VWRYCSYKKFNKAEKIKKDMKRESKYIILVVTIFSIAMAFLETVVVVYLRKLFYPNGFDFPLKGFIDPSILSIEWIREFATIVMLLTIGILAGKKIYSRFAYFIYAFAIWDIFYYVFLKLILNWPSSLFTWDLLFLIPWPWVGPVLAPLLCTVLMIIAAYMIIHFEDKGVFIRLKMNEIALVVGGVIIVLYAWLYDYGKIIISGGYAKDFFTLSTNSQFIEVVNNYIPYSFNWVLFLIGLAVSTFGIVKIYLRIKGKKK